MADWYQVLLLLFTFGLGAAFGLERGGYFKTLGKIAPSRIEPVSEDKRKEWESVLKQERSARKEAERLLEMASEFQCSHELIIRRGEEGYWQVGRGEETLTKEMTWIALPKGILRGSQVLNKVIFPSSKAAIRHAERYVANL
jgi:hypothetical protein